MYKIRGVGNWYIVSHSGCEELCCGDPKCIGYTYFKPTDGGSIPEDGSCHTFTNYIFKTYDKMVEINDVNYTSVGHIDFDFEAMSSTIINPISIEDTTQYFSEGLHYIKMTRYIELNRGHRTAFHLINGNGNTMKRIFTSDHMQCQMYCNLETECIALSFATKEFNTALGNCILYRNGHSVYEFLEAPGYTWVMHYLKDSMYTDVTLNYGEQMIKDDYVLYKIGHITSIEACQMNCTMTLECKGYSIAKIDEYTYECHIINCNIDNIQGSLSGNPDDIFSTVITTYVYKHFMKGLYLCIYSISICNTT